MGDITETKPMSTPKTNLLLYIYRKSYSAPSRAHRTRVKGTAARNTKMDGEKEGDSRDSAFENQLGYTTEKCMPSLGDDAT